MELEEIYTTKLRGIDLINEKMLNLKKAESDIRLELSVIKVKIEKKHSYLIGKRAICSRLEGCRTVNIKAICTKVRLSDNLTAVPLFSTMGGKKVSVEFYEWV